MLFLKLKCSQTAPLRLHFVTAKKNTGGEEINGRGNRNQICPVCENPVEQTGVGRPPVFCCPGCKLQRQHTVRRLLTRVAALEDELRLDRTLHKRGLLLVDHYFRQPLEQLADLAADLEHAQTRLRALLVSAEEA